MDLTLQKDGLWIEGAAELVFDEEMDLAGTSAAALRKSSRC